ncbi:MAG: methyltransferase domain-containing protein [Pseudomonadota bacterium]
MQQSIQFWNRLAEKYAQKPVRDEEAYEQTLERTRSYLKASDQMLELGCGTGTTALKLAKDVAQITASDLSPNMIRIADAKAEKQGTENILFIAADVADSTAAKGARDDRTYDVVAAFNLLHLLEDAETSVRQIHTVLRQDGFFISKTPCEPGKGAPLVYRLLRLALPFLQWIGKAPFVNFMSPNALADMLERNGFKVIETGNYPLSPPNHFIVARKI